MPVTEDQARMIAALAVACRPYGAPRWDTAGVFAAIGRVRHLHLVDVVRAALNAAEDRELVTPGAIGNPTAPCWRDRAPNRAEPVERDRGPWCQTCGITMGRHADDDHPFEHHAPTRDPEAMSRIVGALREQVAR